MWYGRKVKLCSYLISPKLKKQQINYVNQVLFYFSLSQTDVQGFSVGGVTSIFNIIFNGKLFDCFAI